MQTTNNILLVRPSNFVFNKETAASNAFQNIITESKKTITEKVQAEFETFAATLKANGVHVLVFNDTKLPKKPDAIFPNNWVSFHNNGTVILYPMYAVNRRYERRLDIVESLKKDFTVTNIIDLSKYESENKFLEGTGSVVFDHDNKTAYACLSPRTDKDVFTELCSILQYKPVCFYAHDNKGKEIYHTNVMMCIAQKLAIVCLASISNPEERKLVEDTLTNSGHEIVDISFEQMNHFAGNMLAINSTNKQLLVMSQSAYDSLTEAQTKTIESYSTPLPMNIKTIETIGGGSARCMMAEVFLQPKP